MQSKYDEIWYKGSELILSGDSEPDSQIDNPDDSRRGISLLFRPSLEIQEVFSDFQKRADEIESGLYLYAPAEFHTTVMSIITCTGGFELAQIDPSEYAQLVQSCVDQIDSFVVNFKGLTASTSCVMAQGFPMDNTLWNLRELLRSSFRASSLRHSIDERYEIAIAHSTLIRIRTEISRPPDFVDLISRYREFEWGQQTVVDLVLVLNDWYHKSSRVEEIARFRL